MLFDSLKFLFVFYFSIEDILNIPFRGNENDIKTNLYMVVSKIYLSVFEKLFTARKGITKLTRIFINRKKREFEAKKKLDLFLYSQNEEYKKYRMYNNVGKRWDSEREKSVVLQKVALICSRQLDTKNWVEGNILAHVSKYAW